MGLLADLFVASDADALAYEDALGNPDLKEKYAPVEYKGLTNIHLEKLWAILLAEQWDVGRHRLVTLHYGESWLMRFPEGFRKALETIADETISSLSAAWAESEEMKLDRWSEAECAPLINDLRRLARSATASERNLYLWGSL